MEGMNIRSVLEAVNGSGNDYIELEDGITGISIDSRKVQKGELFIAIKGLTMDGHDYVEAAINNGAAAVLVHKRLEQKIPQILVENTSIALSQLAGCYRNRFEIPVIGVTGSTGKTSTKELIASVLSQSFKVHKTNKNFNNEIGLPLTLFALDKSHELAVVELGMSNLEEIRRLAVISKPQIGVITNIGTAHIENLESKENILKAKMEITTFFNKESILILNADDDYLNQVNSKDYIIKTIAIHNKGDFRAYDIINLGEKGVAFKCVYMGVPCDFKLMVPGLHNVYNALCAIAIGEVFHLSSDKVKTGISEFRQVGERMNVITLEKDIKILSDSYNANPDSMKAGIEVLKSYGGTRKIAVLGDMYELGDFSEGAHREIGKYLIGKCDMLIAVGEAAAFIHEEAAGRMESCYFKDKAEAGSYIASIIDEGDVILIKASNGMGLWDITNYLIDDRKKGKQ